MVAAFAGNATHVITIAGTVDEWRGVPGAQARPIKYQRSDGPHGWIRETGQGCFGPAGRYLCVIIEQFDDGTGNLSDTQVCCNTETTRPCQA
jgi:hypothetical protein